MTRDEALNKLMCGIFKAIRFYTDDRVTLSGDPKKPFLYRGIKYAATSFTTTPDWHDAS